MICDAVKILDCSRLSIILSQESISGVILTGMNE